MAADDDNPPGASAAVGGGGNDDDDVCRQGRMLMGKGQTRRNNNGRQGDADGQGTRAGGNNNGRRGQTLTGEG